MTMLMGLGLWAVEAALRPRVWLVLTKMGLDTGVGRGNIRLISLGLAAG